PDDLGRFDAAVAHAHHRALAELLLDLAQGRGKGALLVLVHRAGPCHVEFVLDASLQAPIAKAATWAPRPILAPPGRCGCRARTRSEERRVGAEGRWRWA